MFSCFYTNSLNYVEKPKFRDNGEKAKKDTAISAQSPGVVSFVSGRSSCPYIQYMLLWLFYAQGSGEYQKRR